jgi:Putative zinc-finger
VNQPEPDGLCAAYLLHRVSEEEREQISDRLFADPAFADLMEEHERDLLDRFARGELTADDRAAVEEHLLASDRQEIKLRFAAAMSGRRSQPARSRRGILLTVAGAIAASIIIAAGIRTFTHLPRQQNQLKEAQASSIQPAPTFAALLSPGGTRGGEGQQVHLPKTKGLLRFDLELTEAPANAAYSVQLLQGVRVVWEQPRAVPMQEAGQPILSVRVPATSIAAGRYEFVVMTDQRQVVYRFLVL